MTGVVGAILAGGSSLRMGADKALVEVAGRTMAERVAAALTEVAGPCLVVGRKGVLAGLPALPDQPGSGGGPLAGLVTALRHAGGAPVLVVAVDQPFVRTETLARLAELADHRRAAVPVEDGRPQVTCALYPSSWLEEAGAEAREGGSLRSLVGRMPCRWVPPEEWRAWGEDGRSWFSIDDPERLREALLRFG